MTKFAERTQRLCWPNGMRLLILENTATPTVQLQAALRAGKFLEPRDKEGLSSLTAAMLKRGTRAHSKLELAEIMEDVGAELEVHSNRFLVRVQGQALKEDTHRLLGVCAEVLREPRFPADELDKLKQQAIGALMRQQEQTGVRAFERFSQIVYRRDNPFYQTSVQEQIAAIENLTVEDVHRFYAQYFGASTLVLVMVGDVDARAIERQVGELFGDWSSGTPVDVALERTTPGSPNHREIVTMADKANADVVIGHAGGLRRTDPDYYAAMIANAALGHSTLSSRLGLRVRDQEGLTYGIQCRFVEAGLCDGPWVVSLTVNPENVDRAIDSTLDVINTYVQEGITERELRDEKSAFVGSYIVGLDTNAALSRELLSAEVFGFGPQLMDELPQLVESVTQDQVNEAIRRYIRPESFVTVMAGSLDYEVP
jgi:zinc protease